MTDTLPRARLHAAALALAARTDDGARAALLDYLNESDDPELRDRAELARLEGELEKLTATVWGFGSKAKSRHWNMLTPLQHRITSLQARLSAWPCPECGGKGNWAHGPLCRTCGGTGDTLTASNGDAWFQLPLAWDCGYHRWATLPTMQDAARSGCPRCSVTPDPGDGEWITCRCGHAVPRCLIPTPRLRALAATPPWGVPLEGVRVGDRKPDHDRKDTRAVWFNRDQVSDAAGGQTVIPEPVYTLLLGYDNVPCPPRIGKWYPTEYAAIDALARAVITFAREYRT